MTTVPVLELAALTPQARALLVNRPLPAAADVAADVARILAQVRSDGDAAIVAFLHAVDGVALERERLVVDEDVLARAEASLPAPLRAAMKRTVANLERFHEAQRPHDFALEVEPGVTVGERFLPVRAAGLYVPFGSAVYASSALMLTVPARVAGVGRIVLATGADPASGEIPPAVLAAARLGGATEVWRVSGTVAMAAFAYGTESLAPVDVVAGPGGRYVEAAKRQVRGVVGVDFDAGPSEVLVLDLDADVPAAWIAADVLSEAEHGPDSWAVAVTVGAGRAAEVAAALDVELARMPAARREAVERQATTGRTAVVVAEGADAAVAFANAAAAEHVIVHALEASLVASEIVEAGTVCIGSFAPSPAGSYVAGSNHVLPTGGAARSTGGLSTRHFGRSQSFEQITRDGLRSLAPAVAAYAAAEGLPAHARAVEIRFDPPSGA
jgi:histidinol dehydrogenase